GEAGRDAPHAGVPRRGRGGPRGRRRASATARRGGGARSGARRRRARRLPRPAPRPRAVGRRRRRPAAARRAADRYRAGPRERGLRARRQAVPPAPHPGAGARPSAAAADARPRAALRLLARHRGAPLPEPPGTAGPPLRGARRGRAGRHGDRPLGRPVDAGADPEAGPAPKSPRAFRTQHVSEVVGLPSSDDPQRTGGHRDLPEAGDVRAQHVVVGAAELLGGLAAAAVDVLHDVAELLVGHLEAPAVAAGVLLHLERRGGHPARVRGLAGPEHHARLLERPHGVRRAGQVRALGDGDHAVVDEPLGVRPVQLVLGRAGERHLARHLPHRRAGLVVGARAVLDVLPDAPPLDLLEVLEELEVDAVGVVDAARRVAAGDDLGAELLQLLDRVDRDVARAAHDARAALERLPARGQHLLREVDAAVARGLPAHARAAPVDALPGDHAGLLAVRDALVLAEQVADLALPDADVDGRHVDVLAQVPVQLGHEALAEAHDLVLALALGVEVAAALARADRHAREG